MSAYLLTTRTARVLVATFGLGCGFGASVGWVAGALYTEHVAMRALRPDADRVLRAAVALRARLRELGCLQE